MDMTTTRVHPEYVWMHGDDSDDESVGGGGVHTTALTMRLMHPDYGSGYDSGWNATCDPGPSNTSMMRINLRMEKMLITTRGRRGCD